MTTQTAAALWTIDPAHSIAEFSVRHMMISTVKGRFGAIEGNVRGDESSPLEAGVTVSIDAASINTDEPQRDAHLRSADFFDVGAFPKLTFASKRVERVDAENYRVVGDLTIRDVTKEVVLETEYEGQVKDPWGNVRAGFAATTQLNRKDFGLNWNALLEAGGVTVGDKVKVTLHVEVVRAP
jgi:polyisoprenoid-binding protein YceI